MSDEAGFEARNAAELQRLRRLVDRLSDSQLAAPLNESWTVSAVLAHIAFWDARAAYLANKLLSGQPFSSDESEPEDADWINESHRPLAHAIAPRAAAELAVRTAEGVDRLIASLSAEQRLRAWPDDLDSPLNPLRADHRGEHLDEIEARTGGPAPVG
ncbi:MAG TPA: maleylpyruvate isomerase N-terminal domain-containing protein [Candidatus Limnocylindria bacterium]|nr:maleylpyruvate isomerase N-terminal domain-containing protein [Candidatus Limnocylindria bacterium]